VRKKRSLGPVSGVKKEKTMNITSRSNTRRNCILLGAMTLLFMGGVASAQMLSTKAKAPEMLSGPTAIRAAKMTGLETDWLNPGEPYVVYVGDGPDVPLLLLKIGNVPTAGAQARLLTGSQIQRVADRGLGTFFRTQRHLIRLEAANPPVVDAGAVAANGLTVHSLQVQDMKSGRAKVTAQPLDPVIIICPKGPGSPWMMDVKVAQIRGAQVMVGGKGGMDRFQRLHVDRAKIGSAPRAPLIEPRTDAGVDVTGPVLHGP
jgi:hypothetical protein